jgi:D-sedoheptulose 7-phosphate isomerase
MSEAIRRMVEESLELKKSFFAAAGPSIEDLARMLCRAFASGNKLLIFGNGGSAADAQHIAAELVGRFRRERDPLPAVALTTDSSVLTCVANDYGYDQVFARQVRALGRPGDIAIGISTSGNSPSVLHAMSAAHEMGLTTVAFTGGDGGKLGSLAKIHLNVPHRLTDRVQEVHIMIGHILCQLVEDAWIGGHEACPNPDTQ